MRKVVREQLEEREKQMAETTVTPGLDMAQVLQLIAKMDENNQKNMLAAIQEMKKPSEREQKELDAKDARIKQAQEQRLKMARAAEKGRQMQAYGCQHATTHPGTGVTKHAWRAQIHTPAGEKPYFVPTCQQCLTQLPKILATPEQLTQGINLDQYAGIDKEVLTKWATVMQAA